MKLRQVSLSIAFASTLVASLALTGCAKEGEKSPFATENVSVAPQVEGRAPAPTPIPPPVPAEEPTAESQ